MNRSFYFLVIEESSIARIIIRIQLLQLGQRVDVISSLEEAWDNIKSVAYDMILIDRKLYKVDNPEITSFIQRHIKNDTAPIIAITAQTQHQEEDASYIAPSYFYKPINQHHALALIDYLDNRLNKEK
ncbi:two component system sensor kinase SsrA [Legionella massiliensis]|uniref:Two component system sensor kinase SsrA n=1 Tax=Legionella massiliensis TaxID=1034943 RepID=A0A078KYN3_9GAMM|nr:response regulator [Legionella massiliensis]CDZ79505.1 two component system sensor kinase SsrA [Legionella massiliensis]CEE15243.1 hybrid sensory histidine kinase BarA [Legionella massiliensis]